MMQCPVCKYEEMDYPGEVEPLENSQFQFRPKSSSPRFIEITVQNVEYGFLKPNLYACPKCGSVRIGDE